MARAKASSDEENGSGREAQRRRTRNAILEATAALLRNGGSPSIQEVAEAADVSRRTVYLHFPTMDQLFLDATLGDMTSDVDAKLAALTTNDPRERLRALVEGVAATMARSLPMGRRLIKLTVDAPATDGPRRGYRRIGWIETALAPAKLKPKIHEELVSALAMIIGWEGFIVLTDVRGLDARAARDVTIHTALTLLDAALAR